MKVCIDKPQGGQAHALDGWLEVSGWAAGSTPVCDVTVAAEGCNSVRANYGGSRPDVGEAFPGFHGAAFSGFSAFLRIPADVSKWPSKISVTALCRNGDTGVADVPMPDLLHHIHEEEKPLAACSCCHYGKMSEQPAFISGPYRLQQCDRCGYASTWPSVPKSLLQAIYRDLYWQHASQRPDAREEHYDSEFIANLIKTYHPTARKVIEIGCGPGSLIFGLNKRGYQVQGHDASEEAAKLAKEIYGLGVTVGTMAELPPLAEADVVVMRHVVEHSRTPCEELRVLMRSLKKHSTIIIITPNIAGGLASAMGASWEWFVPPVHLSYFSPPSLATLAFTEGFNSLLIDTRKGDGVAAGEVLPFHDAYTKSEFEIALAKESKSFPEGDCTDFTCASPGLLSDNEVIAVLQKR